MKLVEVVMKHLGVSYKEPFHVEFHSNCSGIYRFTEEFLEFYDKKNLEWVVSDCLEDLLFENTVTSVDFKPKFGDNYYYITNINVKGDNKVELKTFVNDTFDHMCEAVGNCFRTKEEALSTENSVKVNKNIYRALNF